MPLSFLADILELLGEILIAYSVIRAHASVIEQHKIDEDVLKTLKGEQRYAIVGIIFIVMAFAIRLIIG